VFRNELVGMTVIRALAKQKQETSPFSRVQHDLEMERRTWIKSRAELRIERQVAERRRSADRTIPTDERETMTRC
jgi:hypothetical protein